MLQLARYTSEAPADMTERQEVICPMAPHYAETAEAFADPAEAVTAAVMASSPRFM